MDKKEVVVVVPVYRPELTVWERASLRQTVGVLQENYPVELLVPCGMDCSAIRREFSGLPVREVSDEWLGRKNGIAGYNRMMLSAGFYELFRDYEYLLICHTDAWIFRDELGDWCRRGYDCVAAPWVRRKVYDLPILKQYLRWRLRRKRGELDGIDALVDFANKLEKATIATIESGKMTKDLALITTLENPTVLNSENFIKAIRETLEGML